MMKLANEMFGGIELNILTVAAWREWPRRYNYHQTIIPYMKFLCLTDEVPQASIDESLGDSIHDGHGDGLVVGPLVSDTSTTIRPYAALLLPFMSSLGTCGL